MKPELCSYCQDSRLVTINPILVVSCPHCHPTTKKLNSHPVILCGDTGEFVSCQVISRQRIVRKIDRDLFPHEQFVPVDGYGRPLSVILESQVLYWYIRNDGSDPVQMTITDLANGFFVHPLCPVHFTPIQPVK